MIGNGHQVRQLTVYTKPTSKARPRFGNGHAYTPSKTAAYEKMLALSYKKRYTDTMDGTIAVEIHFGFQYPKSWSKKKLEQARVSYIPHTGKPDIDNLVKAVLDGLNKVAWNDDKQIAKITATKSYNSINVVRIVIEQL